MAYITQSNFNRMLHSIRIDNAEDAGAIYKKSIYFLSSKEKQYLLRQKKMLSEGSNLSIEMYTKVINKDTLSFVYESEAKSSYHLDKDCEKLNSSFKNFHIPKEILVRVGEDQEAKAAIVSRFRTWFKRHKDLYDNNTDAFLKRLEIDWNVQRTLQEIEKKNSGIENFENLNLIELENEIDKIIARAGRFFRENPDKQPIIKRFQKLTFLAYEKYEIHTNDTDLSDAELKEFLRKYDGWFKKPIKRLLKQYYRVKYNKDLSFNGELLEQLNFKPCSFCCEK